MVKEFVAQKKRLYEEVIEQFAKLLANGEYAVGDKLPSLPELSKIFEVGKPTLREALSVLVSTGVVEVQHGKGIYVKRLTLKPEREIFGNFNEVGVEELRYWLEFRRTIEFEVAGLAAQRRTNEDLDKIDAIVWEIEKKLERGENTDSLDYEFHIAIALATHNPVFAEALKTNTHVLQHQYFERIRQSVVPTARKEMIISEHRRIYDAIKKGDALSARKMMEKHMDNAIRKLELIEDII